MRTVYFTSTVAAFRLRRVLTQLASTAATFSYLSVANAATIDQIVNPQLGTLWAKAYPDLYSGELRGCVLEYSLLARDFVYKRGSPVSVQGSVTFRVLNPGQIGAFLKVVVNDFDTRTGVVSPGAVTSAYFVNGNNTTKAALLGSPIPSEVAGGIIAGFKLDQTLEVILDGIEANKITIAVARKKGGQDLLFDIDPSVVATADDGKRTRSPKARLDFLQCGDQLVAAQAKSLN